MTKARPKTPSPVYVLKVALADRKNIWRRIAVRANETLDDLHEAIFEAFDRFDEHLYSFYFPLPGAKGRNRLRNAVEFVHPYVVEEEPGLFAEGVRNAARAKLNSLTLMPGQVFLYLFDYGDQWLHKITVEQVDAQPERGEYPRVLERHGQSPPQYPDLDEE